MTGIDGRLRLASSPQMLLNVSTVERNIELTAAWADQHGMELAPHIKTTMTKEIVDRQLGAGAWGVTVATTEQAATAIDWGITRIIIANEIVYPHHLVRLRGWLSDDPDLEIYCLADSAVGIRALEEAFAGSSNPLRVLIDVGVRGGRTGVRDLAEAEHLAQLMEGADGLILAGVSAYEGVAPNNRSGSNIAGVDSHCRMGRDIFDALHASFRTEPPVYSIGGSAFLDRAALFLPRKKATSILRSGCSAIHDHGTYAGVSPIPGLAAAAVVRALVISTPEPGRAVLNAGKRELAYDAGLPVIVASYRGPGGEAHEPDGDVVQLFDHHAIVDGALRLKVGDLVDLGISHPCSLFDRWREIVAVDGEETEIWRPVL